MRRIAQPADKGKPLGFLFTWGGIVGETKDEVGGDVAGLSNTEKRRSRDHDRTAFNVADGFGTDVDTFCE